MTISVVVCSPMNKNNLNFNERNMLNNVVSTSACNLFINNIDFSNRVNGCSFTVELNIKPNMFKTVGDIARQLGNEQKPF